VKQHTQSSRPCAHARVHQQISTCTHATQESTRACTWTCTHKPAHVHLQACRTSTHAAHGLIGFCRYNALFQMLLRLKRVQLRLEEAWQALSALDQWHERSQGGRRAQAGMWQCRAVQEAFRRSCRLGCGHAGGLVAVQGALEVGMQGWTGGQVAMQGGRGGCARGCARGLCSVLACLWPARCSAEGHHATAVLGTTQLSSAQLRAPRRCPPAVLGSSELRSSELSSVVRAPRGCQGSSSVSAGGH